MPACVYLLAAAWLAACTIMTFGHIAFGQSIQPPAGDRGTQQSARSDARARLAHAGNLHGHGGPVKAVRTDAATGLVLTGSFDYAMMVWDVAGDAPQLVHRLSEHDGAVNAVAFLPDGKTGVAATDDGRVALWDLENAKLIHRFSGHQAKIVSVAISPDGRRLATASWDRTARLWNLDTLTDGPVLAGHEGPVNAVSFSADSATLYTAASDGSIGRWSTAEGSLQRMIYKHSWGINAMERLPHSDRLLFGALNGSAGVVDGSTGELTAELPPHGRPVLALAQRDDLVATGSGDGVIRVFRTSDWSLLHEYRNPLGPVWALAFSHQGNALYYGGLDDFVTLWTFSPREPYEQVDSPFPRRFQLSDTSNDPIAQGEIQFARKCSVCHTLKPDGANRAGPTLYQILGRRVASVPGYPYSDALKRLDIIWTEETIARLFELGPEHYTPGSKMPLQRISDAAQRNALVAYLKIATAGQGTDDPIASRQPQLRQAPKTKGDKP